MIVGNGDIAKALTDKEEWIFFASGVSNSYESRESEYQREMSLLLSQDKSKHLVYFSSLSIFLPQTQYTNVRYLEHKKQMEELVKKTFRHFTIIRLGNITWSSNPHTLVNAIRTKVEQGIPFETPDAYKYFIGKNEFQFWLNLIPEWNCEMNITGKRIKLKHIIGQIQKKCAHTHLLSRQQK